MIATFSAWRSSWTDLSDTCELSTIKVWIVRWIFLPLSCSWRNDYCFSTFGLINAQKGGNTALRISLPLFWAWKETLVCLLTLLDYFCPFSEHGKIKRRAKEGKIFKKTLSIWKDALIFRWCTRKWRNNHSTVWSESGQIAQESTHLPSCSNFFLGNFSFGSFTRFKSNTIVDFVENAVEHSRSGRYLFFLNRRPTNGPMRVQLLHPVSRVKKVQSLQHMCRFVL